MIPFAEAGSGTVKFNGQEFAPESPEEAEARSARLITDFAGTALGKVFEKLTTNPSSSFGGNLFGTEGKWDGAAKLYLSPAYRGRVKEITYHIGGADVAPEYNPIKTIAAGNRTIQIPKLLNNYYQILEVRLKNGHVLRGDNTVFLVYSADSTRVPTIGKLEEYTAHMEGDHVAAFKQMFIKVNAAWKAQNSNLGARGTACDNNWYIRTYLGGPHFLASTYCPTPGSATRYNFYCISHTNSNIGAGTPMRVVYGSLGAGNLILAPQAGGGQNVSMTCTGIYSINLPNYTICEGSSVNINPSITVNPYATMGYTWNTGARTPAITVAPPSTTTYTLTSIATSSCQQSFTSTVNVIPKPAVSVNNAVKCANGAAVTLTASGAGSYSWSNGATSQSISVNPGATTNYTVTGSNSGCPGTPVNATVSVLPSPNVSVSGPATVCRNSSVQLTASGASSHVWSPAGTLSSSTGATVTAYPTAASTTYTVVGTAANGCTNAATKVLTLNALTTATANATPISCTNPTSTVSVSASGGSSYAYAWTGPNGFTSTAQSFTTSVTGNYNVTVTNTGTGCTVQAAATVTSTVNNPILLLSGSNPVCTNSPVTVTATVQSGTGVAPFTYTFKNNSGATLQTGSANTLTITPGGIASIVVQVTGANGCSVQQSIPVNSPGPSLSIVNIASICAGQSTTVTADNGGINGYTYVWQDNNTTNPVRNVTPLVSTSYTVVRTTPQGCKDTATSVVNVFEKPVIQQINSTQPSCTGANGSITVTASGAAAQLRYRINSGTWQSSNVFAGLTGGSYTITVGNANGVCNDTTTPPIIITPASNFSSGINGPSARCANEDMQFQVQPSVAGATYAWSATGNPTITNGSTGNNFIARWADNQSGTQQIVTLTVSQGGCSTSYNQPVSITGAIYANAGPDKGMCPASQVTIGTTATFGPGGTTPFATYSWSPAAYIISGANSDKAVVNPPITTVFTLTVTDPVNGCTKTDQVTVTVSVAYNPIADAGTDKVLPVTGSPSTATLGGPNTTQPGAEPNTNIGYVWTALAGSPIGALSSTSSATPVFTRPAGTTAASVYKYVLMVQKQYISPSINAGVTCPAFDTVTITFAAQTSSVCLAPRAYLQGPLTENGVAGSSGSPLMRGDLSEYGLVPLNDPYSAQQSNPVAFLGGNVPAKTTTQSVLGRTGNTAIVDWVVVQLRKADDGALLGSVPALMQRDGYIIDASGSGALCFSGIPTTETIRLSVLHRNHVAIISSQTWLVSGIAGTLSYDFTTSLSKGYGNGSNTQMTFKNGSWAMWAADAVNDGYVDGEDKAPIFKDAEDGQLFFIYRKSDINMDGFFDGQDQNLWLNNNGVSPFSSILAF